MHPRPQVKEAPLQYSEACGHKEVVLHLFTCSGYDDPNVEVLWPVKARRVENGVEPLHERTSERIAEAQRGF